MPFRIEQLPDAPIIICTQQDLNIESELATVLARECALLDEQTEPVFMIHDTRGLSVDLEDMMKSASAAARGQGALAHHPNLRENIVVTDVPLVRMAAQGARSATFGMVTVSVFETLEAALEYCCQQLGIPLPAP